jgi:hydrogenase-4 component B
MLTFLGFGSAMLHLLNHSLFKPLLFFAAGSIYLKTNTRDMDKLGGVIKMMPQTAMLFLIGSLAICGFPPFNGFISEFMLYYGFIAGIKSVSLYHAVLLLSALGCMSLIGGIVIYSFTKSFGVIFLGSARNTVNLTNSETDKWMRVPQYILVLVMLSIGLLPIFYMNEVVKIVASFISLTGFDADPLVKFMNPVHSIGKYAVLFIAFTIVLLFLRYYFVKKSNVTMNPTWGGGHVKSSLKMQYTGKSFSKTLGKILSALVFERKNYKELAGKEYFPAVRKHSAGYTDLFEFRIIDGSLNRIIYFMDRFQFIQNGKLQRYIVYGLVFIILVFLGTVFNFL